MNTAFKIQRVFDPLRFGVWFPEENKQVILQLMEDDTEIAIGETTVTKKPRSKLKMLETQTVEQFLRIYHPGDYNGVPIDEAIKAAFAVFIVGYYELECTWQELITE